MPGTDEPPQEPTRDRIDQTEGLLLLEFGASWCPHCQALAPEITLALAAHPQIRHVKIEDAPGRPLGRSFRVKLWPNLVLLRDGQLHSQLARPTPHQLHTAIDELSK